MVQHIVEVVLDVPLDSVFDYRCPAALTDGQNPRVGQLAVVPFGRRTEVGLVVAIKADSDVPADRLRDVDSFIEGVPLLRQDWLELCRFAASYYQRPLGEVVIPSLPKMLREHKRKSIERALRHLEQSVHKSGYAEPERPVLHESQRKAVDKIAHSPGFSPFVLYGVTGSGKTEVYLHAIETVLGRSRDSQVLFMVPEINLTPQVERVIRERFPNETVATLHSGLKESERLANWLAIVQGKARIILGTRLSILAPAPKLGLIVVDEEHDPSYKQQDGLRYSARDLAVWRARQLMIPVVLGSATPSLETWRHMSTGHYKRLDLPERAVRNAVLPTVRIVNTAKIAMNDGLSGELVASIRKRLEMGEQSLLFLNRRGYAPVVSCSACGWLSTCERCSAYMVFHKTHRLLRCHHCGRERPVPVSCPNCGNVDLYPLGKGTQRVEEGLAARFPDARILRIDADSTSRKGSLEAALKCIHEGDADIIIGTQMVAKGHDFQHLTLVGILNPDTALFSQDFRASERLFALLMQVSGRAGRHVQSGSSNKGEVLIQTAFPEHPLYRAVLSNDYEKYVASLMQERKGAGFPPFGYQALLTAEARNIEDAIAFLRDVSADIKTCGDIFVNDPIPMPIMRIANMERAQLLIESSSRAVLSNVLRKWIPKLRNRRTKVDWQVEIDPIYI